MSKENDDQPLVGVRIEETNDPLVPQMDRESMSVTKARSILLKAVTIHESTLTEARRLDSINEFTAQELMEAATVIFFDLVTTHPWDVVDTTKCQDQDKMGIELKRSNQWFKKVLYVDYRSSGMLSWSNEGDIPRSLYFRAEDQRLSKYPGWERNIGWVKFPVTDSPALPVEDSYIGIVPRNEAVNENLFFYEGPKPFDSGKRTSLTPGAITLDQLRHLWRGNRFMFANMLNWDSPKVLSLAELDTFTDQHQFPNGSNPVRLLHGLGTNISNQ